MIIYPLSVLYFGFLGWCFYMAWYHTENFKIQVDRFDRYMSPNSLCGNVLSICLLSSSIAGMVWSWYQH